MLGPLGRSKSRTPPSSASTVRVQSESTSSTATPSTTAKVRSRSDHGSPSASASEPTTAPATTRGSLSARASTRSCARRRSSTVNTSADDDVHELARHHDRLPNLRTVDVRLHALRCERARDELVLGQLDADLEAVAHLPVHLHDELEGLLLERRPVGDRPRLLPEPLVPERLPQL